MTPKLEAAKARVREAKRALDKAIYTQQRRCNHQDVAEAPYQHSDFGNSFPPMRVCRKCGMVEDGWCCGYLVLEGEAAPITREELYRLRHGVHITADDKGPLLRREVGIRDLAAQWYSKAGR